MILFVSGAMTGHVDYNRSAFILAEARLSELGHTVLSPANHIPIHDPEAIPHSGYIAICCAMIDQADAIVQLPGWEESLGSRMERGYAMQKHKPIFSYEQMEVPRD